MKPTYDNLICKAISLSYNKERDKLRFHNMIGSGYVFLPTCVKIYGYDLFKIEIIKIFVVLYRYFKKLLNNDYASLNLEVLSTSPYYSAFEFDKPFVIKNGFTFSGDNKIYMSHEEIIMKIMSNDKDVIFFHKNDRKDLIKWINKQEKNRLCVYFIQELDS